MVGFRGAFFILDADTPEELGMFFGEQFKWLDVKPYPIVSMEKLGEMLAQM